MLDALKDRKRYLVGPFYDWALFLLPPLWALGVGVWISDHEAMNAPFVFWGQNETWSALLIGVVIHAHLFIVFFRSHGNKTVFETFPRRFVLAPLLLYAAMMAHDRVLVTVSVLATFWDVYHSGAQTFGFARIYDMKAGNDPQVGRRLDFWLNQLLYAGPIVAGAVMLDHFEDLLEFEDVGVTFFSAVPVWIDGHQSTIAWVMVSGGSVFLAFYLFMQWRFAKQGHAISPQKTFLLVATGFCSIYCWGFNSWGEAFLIMNLFHAVQYFALVWGMERDSMTKLFRLDNAVAGKAICWFLFLALAVGYGYFTQAIDGSVKGLLAITLVVSIMHFWYDGFIWSVRRKQV